MIRYPNFNSTFAKRMTDDQQEVYMHVCGLLNRDHPIYTVDRKWLCLAEVKRDTKHDYASWVAPNGNKFEAVSDIVHGYYFVVKMTEWDRHAKIDRDTYGVYQVTNKGRAIVMGNHAFSTKVEAEEMIEILNAIENGEF